MVVRYPGRDTSPCMGVFETAATLDPLKGHRPPEDASITFADVPTSGAETPLKGHVLTVAAD